MIQKNVILATATILLCCCVALSESKVYKTIHKRTTQAGQCRTVKYEHTIEIPGCIPKRVKMRMCAGACDSRITGQRTECSRCYPESMKEATAILECKNGERKKVKYLRLRNCKCRKLECKKWKPEERVGFTRIKFYT